MEMAIPAPLDPIEELLDIAEVARRLKLSEDTVYRWIQTGELPPPLYLNKLPRWRVRDFNHYIEERASKIKIIEAAALRSAKREARKRAAERIAEAIKDA